MGLYTIQSKNVDEREENEKEKGEREWMEEGRKKEGVRYDTYISNEQMKMIPLAVTSEDRKIKKKNPIKNIIQLQTKTGYKDEDMIRRETNIPSHPNLL